MGADRLAVASAAAISMCLHFLWLTTNLRSYKAHPAVKLAILAIALSVYAVFLGGSAHYFRSTAADLEREERTNVDGF